MERPFLFTKEKAKHKKAVGFTHAVVCVIPSNSAWMSGDVLRWCKSKKAATKKAKGVHEVVQL